MAAAGLVLVLLDQVTKWFILTFLAPGASWPVIHPYLFLTHVQNPGAAFGLMANWRPVFIGVTIAATIVVWWKRKAIRSQTPLFQWGLTVGLAGALGNLIDRIRFGRVIDFIDFRFFWVFNVADAAIVIGVGLMIWEIMRLPEQR